MRAVVSGVLLSPGEMKGTSNYAHCRAWSETSGATLHRDHGNTSVPTGQAGAGAGAVLVLVLIKLNQDPAAAESEEQGRAPRPDPSS